MENVLSRIQKNEGVLSGKPIVRGMRITVDQVLSMLSEGWTWEEIKAEFPVLEDNDIRACLLYAQNLIENISVFYFSPSQKNEEKTETLCTKSA